MHVPLICRPTKLHIFIELRHARLLLSDRQTIHLRAIALRHVCTHSHMCTHTHSNRFNCDCRRTNRESWWCVGLVRNICSSLSVLCASQSRRRCKRSIQKYKAASVSMRTCVPACSRSRAHTHGHIRARIDKSVSELRVQFMTNTLRISVDAAGSTLSVSLFGTRISRRQSPVCVCVCVYYSTTDKHNPSPTLPERYRRPVTEILVVCVVCASAFAEVFAYLLLITNNQSGHERNWSKGNPPKVYTVPIIRMGCCCSGKGHIRPWSWADKLITHLDGRACSVVLVHLSFGRTASESQDISAVEVHPHSDIATSDNAAPGYEQAVQSNTGYTPNSG